MFEDRGNHLIIKEFENMGIGTIFTDNLMEMQNRKHVKNL